MRSARESVDTMAQERAFRNCGIFTGRVRKNEHATKRPRLRDKRGGRKAGQCYVKVTKERKCFGKEGVVPNAVERSCKMQAEKCLFD